MKTLHFIFIYNVTNIYYDVSILYFLVIENGILQTTNLAN